MKYAGDYNAATAYAVGDCVFGVDGETYQCVKANTGMPYINTTYWHQMTKENKETMELIKTGTEKSIEDVIANNLTTTEEGYALDARQGKNLYDLIHALDARVKALEDEVFPTPEPDPDPEP